MPTPTWFDKDGRPMTDYIEIEKKLRDFKYKSIAKTGVGKHYVSTVWLGLDHDFTHMSNKLNPRPIIFETMVFEKEERIFGKEAIFPGRHYHESLDDFSMRYATLAEAKAGHKAIVKQLKELEK